MDTDYAEICARKGMLGDYVPDNGTCARFNVFVLRKDFLTLSQHRDASSAPYCNT
jgi:hypothetical protein